MGKFKVVITDREYESIDNELRILNEIGAEVYDYQVRDEQEVIDVARDCDGLIVQYAKVSREIIASLERCKVIARYATGVDGIDIEAATGREICVTNVNDYCRDEVSTHALTLLLELSRKIRAFSGATAAGKWYQLGISVESLKDSVVGVISFGKIARAYIEKLKPLCDHIWVFDQYVDPQAILDFGAIPKSFEELIAGADYISIHAPLTNETRHMFGKEVFRAMKNTASIVNVARGGLVCEEDLLWALERGEIAGAALDVLES